MTPSQFEDHIGTIQRYAAQSPDTIAMAPQGVSPGASPNEQSEKYQAKVNERAVELCTAKAGRTYDEGLELARKEMEKRA